MSTITVYKRWAIRAHGHGKPRAKSRLEGGTPAARRAVTEALRFADIHEWDEGKRREVCAAIGITLVEEWAP